MLRELLNRNLLLLFGCQIIVVSGTVVLVTVGGIIGSTLTPDARLATLPVALMVVGTALATVPAAFTMQALGRRWGFMVGIGLASTGAFIAHNAVAQQSFVLFCLATAFMGSALGFSQQFRFAAAESVSPERVSYAVSFLLMGSILGAFVSPEVIAYSAAQSPQTPYASVFILLIGLYVVAALLLLGIRTIAMAEEDAGQASRPFSVVVRQPIFVTAVLAGMVGQGVMTYVMTATPMSMNLDSGYSIQETSEVVRAHVIAMYLPSLFTPFLIARFGLSTMMAVGTVAMAATIGIGLMGHHYMHYWWSMVLLGVGWNFLFVSGTTMLTQTYRPEERFRSQAVNDFGVFSASALASLLAGSMLHTFGWDTLLYSGIPALLLMLAAVLWLRSRPLPSRA